MANQHEIKASEITDKHVYLNRRAFMRAAAIAGTVTATGFVYRKLNPAPTETPKGEKIENFAKLPGNEALSNGYSTNEQLTPLKDITNYNNFYEFSTDKSSVAPEASGFVVRPWSVAVSGLVNKPKVFSRSAFTDCVALKAGRWSFHGSVFLYQNCWKKLNRLRKLGTWRFKRCWIRSVCRISTLEFLIGHTLRDCGWTKPCTR